ncbi:MAG: DUF997 domain-containing protein [Pseudomonadota bacterium]
MRSERKGKEQLFLAIFCVLTFFTWRPLGYGAYGPVDRIFGIPSWAAAAFGLGVLLFILEWVYLFGSRLSLSDDDLTVILSALKDIK